MLIVVLERNPSSPGGRMTFRIHRTLRRPSIMKLQNRALLTGNSESMVRSWLCSAMEMRL